MQTSAITPSSSTQGSSWLSFFRRGWIPIAMLYVLIFLIALPGLWSRKPLGEYYGGRLLIQESQWTPLVLRLTLVAFIAGCLLCIALAFLLFRRQPNNRMALFLSYFLLLYGLFQIGVVESLEYLWAEVSWFSSLIIVPLIVHPAIVTLILIFPDGRFMPRWSRWLIPLTVFFGAGYILFSDPFSGRLPLQQLPQALYIPLVVLFLGYVFLLVGIQVHRYRNVSTPSQRQQAKWLMSGLVISWVIIGLASIPWVWANNQPDNAVIPWWIALIELIYLFASCIPPVALTIAILRHRLYDIDVIISRGLVYSTLSAAVIALYVLLVAGLSALFQSQQNLLIAALVTGIVAFLFQPIHNRLQSAVNRLVYGDRDDPLSALSRLGQMLEVTAAHEEILPKLVETISRSLKLPYVAIQLRENGNFAIAAESGKHKGQTLALPLAYQGDTVGKLLVGHRQPGEDFDQADLRLLENIALQAGPAVYSIQVTSALRQSRQQIVETREEERRRIRRDLHDGLGATLAALNLEVGLLRRSIRPDPAKAEGLADELRADIKHTIEDIRKLVYDLRPPVLDQLGLVEAIRVHAAHCSRPQDAGHLPLQIKVTAPTVMPILPAAVEVAVYRIAQEALTNVVRHAEAQQCHLNLWVEDKLLLEIVDDGVGFNREQEHGGIGLLSMRERAAELGGTCTFEQLSGRGTRVLASLPLEKD